MPLAPIVLFVYDRSEHTRRTLESLMTNDLADQSELFIYCDGPKENASDAQKGKINAVRNVIRQKKWCGKVTIFESDKNLSHPVNVVRRVTEILDRFERIIVLEDDLVLGKGFLKYMNEALELYKEDASLMHVSGYTYPLSKSNLPSTFFLRYMSCWGWGTWKRAWDHFVHDPSTLLGAIKKNQIPAFNIGKDGYDFYGSLETCVKGPWKSWDIRWYASIFIKDGLVLFPNKSLVRNIGHDASGMHCPDSTIFSSQPVVDYITVNRMEISENAIAREALKQTLSFIYGSESKGLQYLKKIFRKILPEKYYAYLRHYNKILEQENIDKLHR